MATGCVCGEFHEEQLWEDIDGEEIDAEEGRDDAQRGAETEED
jgi:hypothetical protein